MYSEGIVISIHVTVQPGHVYISMLRVRSLRVYVLTVHRSFVYIGDTVTRVVSEFSAQYLPVNQHNSYCKAHGRQAYVHNMFSCNITGYIFVYFPQNVFYGQFWFDLAGWAPFLEYVGPRMFPGSPPATRDVTTIRHDFQVPGTDVNIDSSDFVSFGNGSRSY